ncbi:MAG: thrombospondin type 3 repeat-containing protein [Fibrobacteria bacterium]
MILATCLFASSESDSRTAMPIPDATGLPGVFSTHASNSMRPGTFVLGISGQRSSRLSVSASGLDASGDEVTPPTEVHGDAAVSGFTAFLSSGLGSGFDVALELPWYSESLPGFRDRADIWSLGDIGAVLKARLPFDIPFTSLAFFASASAPTSADNAGWLPKRPEYRPTHDAYPDPVAHAAGFARPAVGLGAGVTFHLSAEAEGPQVAMHANVSALRAFSKGSEDPPGNLAASLAAEAFLFPWLRMNAELRQHLQVAGYDRLTSPQGRTTALSAGLAAEMAWGFCLQANAVVAPSDWNPYRSLTVRDAGRASELRYREQPLLSFGAQMSWHGFPLARDRDHDGVPDNRDKCPLAPEDRDGFQDEDGCPEQDNDGDGIPDAADNCPYAQEDHDGIEDEDGCPEVDNDHDGILDTGDRCPNNAEDADGFQDQDGCPDADNDQDGIPDTSDKCPSAAENRNGVEDQDGCPEADTDGDGIPDASDKCPREREIVNFYLDGDGCPDEKPEPIRDAVLAGVIFGEGAELLPSSYPGLDSLAARMLAYPGTEIEIHGYADDRSGPQAKALTRSRAEAVAEYLTAAGVESRRMKPAGYGSSTPIAPNRTAQGRAANRRIEIHRLN